MNNYYHMFKVGFNFWYVFVPVSLVIAVVISSALDLKVRKIRSKVFGGKRIYHLKKRHKDGEVLNPKTIKRYQIDRIARLAISAGFSGIFIALLFLESFDGITQWCLNSLSKTDMPVWGDALALSIVIALTIIFFVLFETVLKVGSWLGERFIAGIDILWLMRQGLSRKHIIECCDNAALEITTIIS